MPGPRPYGAELIEEYFWLRRDGFTPERIAHLWEVDVETLKRALHREGVSMHDRPWLTRETTSASGKT